MSDKPKITGETNAPSGIMHRPVDEPPKPDMLPSKRQREHRDELGATTGMMPAVTEGTDAIAERDSDRSNGQ